MRRKLSIFLVFAMLLTSFAALPSCNSSSNRVEEPQSVTDSETQNESETEEPIVQTTYPNGEEIKNAGTAWTDKSFALTENEIDQSKAVEISANELLELLMDKKALTGSEVYVVEDEIVLDGNSKYYGNLARVIAKGGILIKDVSDVVVKELVVSGDIRIENSQSVTFFKLDLKGGDTAVKVDEKSSEIVFKSCKICANESAVIAGANDVSFYQCYISAPSSITSVGDRFVIQDSKIESLSLGVSLGGNDCIVKNNIIALSSDGIGVSVASGSENALIALNIIKDAQKSVELNGGYNCAIIMNSLISLHCAESTNLYVVDNKLGGRITLKNNRYIVCDSNTYPSDVLDHSVISEGNSDYNGNGLADVSERAEYGVNENILPHTNKDLFAGMERKTIVSDVSLTKKYNLATYIRTMAEDSGVVIVPPGAYSTSTAIMLQGNHSGTTVYAYGAMCESDVLDNILQIQGAANINIKGLTLAYTHQSSGQVHVLEKLGNNSLLVVENAGFINEFGRSDPSVFANVYFDVFKKDEGTPWLDGGCRNYTVTHNSDGTMVITMTDANASRIYNAIEAGDVLACRLAGNNKRSIFIGASNNILLKDFVLYGYTAALGVVATQKTYNVTLERFHNTSSDGMVIDKETYDRYVQYESTYGTDLGVRIDERGNYRGGAAKFGSVDGVHVIGVKQGINVVSSIFENMCDDGANQRGDSSRLAGIRDNKDGTTSVFIKGNLTEEYFKIHSTTPATSRTPYGMVTPVSGDRLYAYTASGEKVFDTKAISDAVVAKETSMHLVHTDSDGNGYCDVDMAEMSDDKGVNIRFYPTTGQITYQLKNDTGNVTVTYSDYVYEVKVKTSEVNFDALANYDLLANGCAYADKVIIDNLSANSADFTYDNVLIQNTRTRGIVAKTVGVTLMYSTFRNVSNAGVLLSTEPSWGEGTVPREIAVMNCHFDNTGSYLGTNNQLKKACIAILGLGEASNDVVVSENTLTCSDITIMNNKFSNINNNYAIVINAARNVTVKGNFFEERGSESEESVGKAIYVNGCMNIEISQNKYSSFAGGDNTKVIVAINYSGLTGSDVEGVFAQSALK